MISSEDEARAYCAGLVDAAALVKLERYVSLLSEENRHQNLVSAASLGQVWQRHIADSLQLLHHVRTGAATWLDLGTGAGPPGLVIAIGRPDLAVFLVDSRKRRAKWLDSLATALALERCTTLSARLEDVAAFPADIISARAFAPLGKLLRLSTRFSTPDTVWLLPKGRSAAMELEQQESPVRSMFHVEQSVTDPLAGLLIGRGKPELA